MKHELASLTSRPYPVFVLHTEHSPFCATLKTLEHRASTNKRVGKAVGRSGFNLGMRPRGGKINNRRNLEGRMLCLV